MEKSTFFNAIETSEGVFDRTYDAGDFAEYFANFIGNGIYDNGLKVESVTGNRKVSITKGKAFINGYYYWNTTPVEFDVSLPTVNEREDCVVLRLDLSQRRIYLAYKEGTVEATRNNYIYELLLAMVTITSDDIREIPQRQIVDTRFNRTYCG